MTTKLNRRDFLKIAGVASTGALAACSSVQPQKLIPYVIPPEGVVPGVSTYYKSVCRECPAGCGIMVRTREGRVLKVEGNPEHPVNRGALCARGQAATQGLYNPDRIPQPLRRNEDGKLEPITWEQAEEIVANLLRYLRFTGRAERVALVSERVTGSMESLLREWLAAVGSRHFLQYEPFAYEALRAANRITFGTSEIPYHDFSGAQFLISFGADFQETYLSNVEFTRQFSEMRKRFYEASDRFSKLAALACASESDPNCSELSKRRPMPGGRFVYIGPRLSLTAANADEWIACKPDTEMCVALCLLDELLSPDVMFNERRAGRSVPLEDPEVLALRSLAAPFQARGFEERTGVSAAKIRSLADELKNGGFVLGPGTASSGPWATGLQTAVNLLNYANRNLGRHVFFGRGADWDTVARHRELFDFVEQMRTDQFDVVFFHHTNPAYTLPEAAGFGRGIARVPFKVSFSPFLDETTALCDLVLPDATPLERWEDYSPRAGVHGLAQPTMAPGFPFQSRQTGDFLLSVSRKVDEVLAGRFSAANFYEYMREQWKTLHNEFAPQKPFEEFWREAVEAGGVWKEVPARSVKLNDAVFRFDFAGAAQAYAESEKSAKPHELHLIAYPSLQLFDGRGANKPWLQETPEAMTKIVWDSWAEIHPDTAKRMGISEGDLLKLTSSSGGIQAPAHLYEGIRPDSIAVPLGQGHTSYGRWAEGHGPSPMKLLPALTEAASGGLLWSGTRISVEKLAVNRPLAQTQIETRENPDRPGREIVQVVPLSALLGTKSGGGLEGKTTTPESHPALSMFPAHAHTGHRWGMTIDLNACVGCNACIVACYAENNVTWMGKEQVARGRHMAWIRLDRYFYPRTGDSAAIGFAGVETRFMPMLCQQCDNAPCETVCPVYATYHNHEGLNVQVYNRCVGTRYCSNNCPYKVRRFNWFDHEWPWPLQLGLNPDVSARSKGVMEKCTFCIQRVRAGKDIAKDEKRTVRDGEITPACAQTCPANAIVFGDLNDPKSRVAQLAKDPRGYHVLGELNTRPAITYLKKVIRGEEGS